MFICCPRITIRTRYLELPKRCCSFPGNELGRWPMPVGGRGAANQRGYRDDYATWTNCD